MANTNQSKRPGLLLGLIFLLLVLLSAAAWYGHVRTNGIHLSATAFIDKAGSRDTVGTLEFDQYIGHRDGRVLFGSRRMSRIPKWIIYWTELDGLPPAVAEEVRAGTGRWALPDVSPIP